MSITIDDCESPRRCGEANMGPPKERQVLLTTDPSIQALDLMFQIMYLCMCVCVWYVDVGAGIHRGQRRAPDSMELELQACVSCLMWVLGIKFPASCNSRHCS